MSAPPRVIVTRVGVTRASDQAGELAVLLRQAGLEPVLVPVIRIEEPEDGGRACREAAAALNEQYDWVVFTSVNAVERVLAYAPPPPWLARVAAIGPATAGALRHGGIDVALVPPRFVGESLVEQFPTGSGRVLLPRAAVARDVVPEGLRAKGWTVDVVPAYRTSAVQADEHLRSLVGGCDVITFTAPSTVTNFVEVFGAELVPRIVACIGPVTAARAREKKLPVHVEAEVHTMPGLVSALQSYLDGRR